MQVDLADEVQVRAYVERAAAEFGGTGASLPVEDMMPARVEVREVVGELRVSAANGRISVEKAHAAVTAKTANGDVRTSFSYENLKVVGAATIRCVTSLPCGLVIRA